MTLLSHEVGSLETTLHQMPDVLREKYAKAALRKATKIFQAQAKANVQRLKAEGRDRWGHPDNNDLARSIRRRLRVDGMNVVGTTLTTGMSRLYAAAVEYGHRAFIFGVWDNTKMVQRHQFWRPAKMDTRAAIDATINHELKRMLNELRGVR